MIGPYYPKKTTIIKGLPDPLFFADKYRVKRPHQRNLGYLYCSQTERNNENNNCFIGYGGITF